MRIHPVNCLILLLIVTAVPCRSRSFAEIETPSLHAFVGTCVEIRCGTTDNLPDEDVLWFWVKDGKWDQAQFTGTNVYSNEPRERPISPLFEGRVTYTGATRLTNRGSSCSVLICDLRRGDSGQYLFRYISKERDFKWSTMDVVINVAENPCPITFNKPAPVNENQTITLTCSTLTSCSSNLEIESVPPSGLRTSSVRSTATASFTPSWKDDGREFTCQTRGNKDKQLMKKTTISVQDPPRDTQAVVNSTDVKEGDSLTLTCSAKGKPAPVFTWKKNNQSESSVEHRGAIWKIDSAQIKDSGDYVCTAQNQHGTETSDKVHIDVQFGPKQAVVMRSEEVQGPDGSRSVTLSCSSLSLPLVSLYTWYRRTEGRELKVSEGMNYTVVSTQPGVYYCTAKNSINESTSEPVSLFQTQSNLKYIFTAFILAPILLAAFFFYRLVRHLVTKSETQEAASEQRLETSDNYENIDVGRTDRRESEVEIDVCRSQVKFRTTAH